MLILMKVKAAMLAGALTAPILATALTPTPPHDQDGALRLTSTSFSYRAAGDFSKNDRPVEGPLRHLRLPADLLVMKRQVTVAEYARCVDDGACPRVALPQVRRMCPSSASVGMMPRPTPPGCRARPASFIVCRPTKSGRLLPPKRRVTKRQRSSTPPIRHRRGSLATRPNPPAPGRPRLPRSPAARSAPTATGWMTSPAMSGSGPIAASCALRWTASASRSPTPIAASASWKARIAPT